MSATSYLLIILVMMSILASVFDLILRKIPNLLNYLAILLGLLYHSWLSGMAGLCWSAAGLTLGISLLIIPYIMGTMGGGDVKFLGAVGAFVGPLDIVGVFLLASIAGGIYAVGVFLCKRGLFSSLVKHYWQTVLTMILTKEYAMAPIVTTKEKSPRLCYGVALGAGTTLFIALKSFGYHLPILT